MHPQKLARLTARTGLTIVQLHGVWHRAQHGDVASQTLMRQVLNRAPRTRLIFDMFDADGAKPANPKKRVVLAGMGRHKVETLWQSAKPKWIYMTQGGLPSLGRRR